MSLDRKDLRIKLDPDVHAGLSLLSDVTDRDMAEIVENLVREFVVRRLHEASVIAERSARLGIAGIGRESAGRSGSGRE